MENTLENKAKFFALYIFQKQIIVRNGFQNRDNNSLLIDECDVLELKSLSSITDSDLKNIALFYEPTASNVKLDNDQIIFDFLYGEENESAAIEITQDFALDYTRSKGYANVWMELGVNDLISYGWIKLKTD